MLPIENVDKLTESMGTWSLTHHAASTSFGVKGTISLLATSSTMSFVSAYMVLHVRRIDRIDLDMRIASKLGVRDLGAEPHVPPEGRGSYGPLGLGGGGSHLTVWL